MRSWILYIILYPHVEKTDDGQGFNQADFTLKEISDFFDNREKTLEAREEKKKIYASQKQKKKKSPQEKEKICLQLQCCRV